jgi:hypothetical protein
MNVYVLVILMLIVSILVLVKWRFGRQNHETLPSLR